MKTRTTSLFLMLSLLGGNLILQAEEPEETTLHGYFVERADGTYLHIEMVGVRMIFRLVDENYQPLENVFTRGWMRVDVRGDDSERMAIQPAEDGFSLRSVKPIRMPHILEARGRLFKGDDDETGEHFFVSYNQHQLETVEVKPAPDE